MIDVTNILNGKALGVTLQGTQQPLFNVDHIWCDSTPTVTESLFGCASCFMLKKSDSCDTFYLIDTNDYSIINSGALNVTIDAEAYTLTWDSMSYSVDFKGSCDNYYINILSGSGLQQGGQTTITASKGDGDYKVSINVSVIYTDTLGVSTTYTQTYVYNILTSCCETLCEDMKYDIECKLGGISCKINNNEKIGRETTSLYFDVYRLLNILWVIDNFTLDCKCLEQLKCGYEKIKNC